MTKEKQKRAAIYIRVSTDFQAEEGYSIDAQKEQLTAYCVSKGIKNYDYYIDGGWSGSNIERPEMKRLIEDVENDEISHVIVYKLDRLSRSQKDTLYLIEDVFNPHDVAFVSLNETMDTSTPMGRLMIGILSAFAQLERENIRLRTRMGMKERVKNGYWMGGGRIPFGYDYDQTQGILVPNQDAEKVKQIYDLYIKGYSSQKIADMLGLKYDRLVTQILIRKSNYGMIEYNGEVYQGRHEAVISKETYDLAMKEMKKRLNKNPAKTKHLLAGLVVCGKCGAKMRYLKWGKQGYKLVCYSQMTSKPYLIKDPNCDQMKVWADDVEREILDKIFQLKEDKSKLNLNPNLKISKKMISNIELLNQQKSELEKKIKNLYNIYASSEDELLLETIKENQKKLKDINDSIKSIEIENEKLSAVTDFSSIVQNLRSRWEYMDIREKQQVLKSIINKIRIKDETVELQLLI